MANAAARKLQLQHLEMARKRQRARRQQQAPSHINSHTSASDAAHNAVNKSDNVRVNIRQINAGDEGVLYTHRITVSFC